MRKIYAEPLRVPRASFFLLTRTCVRASSRSPSAPAAAGSSAVSRLKVVLAHDRTGLDEITMAKIRGEIQAVVAKYVTIAVDDVMFDMQSDDELTLVTATFPLQVVGGARPLDRQGSISSAGPSLAP